MAIGYTRSPCISEPIEVAIGSRYLPELKTSISFHLEKVILIRNRRDCNLEIGHLELEKSPVGQKITSFFLNLIN